jgi:hypothetical protein
VVEVPGGPAGKATVVGPMGDVPAGLLLLSTMAAAPAGAAMAVCRGYWCWCRLLRCQRPGALGSPVVTVPGAVVAGCTVHCSPAAAGADTHTLLVGAGVLLLTMEVVVTGWRQPMLLSAAASVGVREGDSRRTQGVEQSGCMCRRTYIPACSQLGKWCIWSRK